MAGESNNKPVAARNKKKIFKPEVGLISESSEKSLSLFQFLVELYDWIKLEVPLLKQKHGEVDHVTYVYIFICEKKLNLNTDPLRIYFTYM